MRQILLRTVLLVAAVAIVARLSWAQWGYNSASTLAEGNARGLSEVVRAEGQRNVMNAEAAKNYEQARSQYIQNQLQYTEQYFAAKRMKQEDYRAEQARKNQSKATPETLYRAALATAPKRLMEKELDPATGKISWPKLLALPPYEKDREELEASFTERAAVGELDGEQYLHVQQTTKHLLAELKSHIREYPSQDYIPARGFGDRLIYEARFAATAPVASRSGATPPKPPAPNQ